MLSAWAKANNISVHAPSDPTFVTPRDRSTIDLFLSRGISLAKPAILSGIWNGTSDHIPTQTVVQMTPRHSYSHFTPTKLLLSADTVQEARKLYESELPKITAKLKAARSTSDIEAEYRNFVDVILAPWQCPKLRGRWSHNPLWDDQLQSLAKERDRAFRLARASDTQEAWEDHRRIDRRIKKIVSKRKRAKLRQQINALLEVSTTKAQKWLSRTMRRSSSAARVESQYGLPLCPPEFTAHADNPRRRNPGPAADVVPPANLESILLSAIQALPHGTAPGPDVIYYEMLKAAPRVVSQTLAALWAQCGTLAYTPKMWNRGTLVPAFKKGNPQLPKSYRPICLLSAARKVVERALTRLLDDSFTPNIMQLLFQSNLGTEMVIAQAVHSIQTGAKWVAVLDLKSAYDRVHRDRLQGLCDDMLPTELANMVSHLLQPLTISTEADVENKLGIINQGVRQGGPAITKLCNIYINPLADTLEKAFSSPNRIHPAKLYADDVILLLQALWQLILALRICEDWVSGNGMEWAVRPGKSGLFLSPRNCEILPSLHFAGLNIKSVTKAKYLGVLLTTNGVSEDTASVRIRNAHSTLSSFRNAKILVTRMHPRFALTVFQSLLQSQTDYGSFFSPCTAGARTAYNSLLCRFFGMAFGTRMKPSQLPRMAAMDITSILFVVHCNCVVGEHINEELCKLPLQQ